MFSKPYNGWTTLSTTAQKKYTTDVKLIWHVSFLSNIPIEILVALLNWYTEHKSQLVNLELEEKGRGSMLIMSDGQVQFINTTYNYPTIYRLGNIDEIVDEILEDFENEIDAWSDFFCMIDNNSRKKNKEKIQKLIENVKAVK